jgi:hypothetical protein
VAEGAAEKVRRNTEYVDVDDENLSRLMSNEYVDVFFTLATQRSVVSTSGVLWRTHFILSSLARPLGSFSPSVMMSTNDQEPRIWCSCLWKVWKSGKFDRVAY